MRPPNETRDTHVGAERGHDSPSGTAATRVTAIAPPAHRDAPSLSFAHRRSWNLALGGFGLLVAAYWAASPWMVQSEVLHYVHALVVLAGLSMLRPAFTGNARQWWLLALGLQLWSYGEHFLLIMQLGTGWRLAGETMPTSILQLLVPRVEMHVFYNAIVTIAMIVALILRALDRSAHTAATQCS